MFFSLFNIQVTNLKSCWVYTQTFEYVAVLNAAFKKNNSWGQKPQGPLQLKQSILLCWQQNKLKKMKEKYKDQDEEDRELMMQLLGVPRTHARTHEQTQQGTHLRSPALHSRPVRARTRKTKLRKARRGRAKRSPRGSPLLRSPLPNLARRWWRPSRNRSRWPRMARRRLLRSKRTRYQPHPLTFPLRHLQFHTFDLFLLACFSLKEYSLCSS